MGEYILLYPSCGQPSWHGPKSPRRLAPTGCDALWAGPLLLRVEMKCNVPASCPPQLPFRTCFARFRGVARIGETALRLPCARALAVGTHCVPLQKKGRLQRGDETTELLSSSPASLRLPRPDSVPAPEMSPDIAHAREQLLSGHSTSQRECSSSHAMTRSKRKNTTRQGEEGPKSGKT